MNIKQNIRNLETNFWGLLVIVFLFFGCKNDLPKTPQFGMYEIAFESGSDTPFQFPKISFVLPDKKVIEVDGFYDGEKTYKARAYCSQPGVWKWKIHKSPGFKKTTGKFEVVSSELKGKLKKHKDDSHQFARDNGEWFLHIGDTGYRYLSKTEPKWKEYFNQASKIGMTKIRTWFCSSRHNVEALFDDERNNLNLPYWQEMDKRIAYAFEHDPDIILQLIPFGEDTEELKRYLAGDSIAHQMIRYAQARFSAYPNMIWCISNDREIVDNDVELTGRRITKQNIKKIAKDMAVRKPWETLLTNHQSRFRGYSFVDEPWSDIVTLEDLDQIDGRIIREYRAISEDPIVIDEDRYEIYRGPENPDYFFRRLMWASLLSGGHATYGGVYTYVAWEPDSITGVQGYFDAGLKGADSFNNIHKFFDDTKLTLVGMQPDDELVGSKPQRYKCIHNDSVFIVYLANPDKTGRPERPGDKSTEIRSTNESTEIPEVSIDLPENKFTCKWFDPGTGEWADSLKVAGGPVRLQAPGSGDWILLLHNSNP